MNCPNCGGSLGVVNTYQSDPIRRRRVCKSCGYVLYTCEIPETNTGIVRKIMLENGYLIDKGVSNGGCEEEEAVKQNGKEKA